MYHAEYWHDNFPAPMVFINNKGSLFVNDFITFNNVALGDVTVGKVQKIVQCEGCCVFSLLTME